MQVCFPGRSVAQRIEARAGSGHITGFPPTLVLLSTVDATVSPDAVIDNLLEHLAPEGHELLLFDINRSSVKTTILVSDPGPLTVRLMDDRNLPFHLTLVTNESKESTRVVLRRWQPDDVEGVVSALDLAWPDDVYSLSHVALPFPEDDPLYGRFDTGTSPGVWLGMLALRGERGVLRVSPSAMLRLRWNPFYSYLERRALEFTRLQELPEGTTEQSTP